MRKLIGDYKIGDELFRHVECGGTFRYVVQGIRTFADGAQLEVECQTCSHGWKCRLLLAQNDFCRIVAVHMLNEDDEDAQSHWHSNTEGLHFCETAREAREEGLQLSLRRANERVDAAKQKLADAEKWRDQLRAAIEEQTP